MNRITKTQIAKRIILPRRMEGELRDMKILTAFKRNIVEFTYKRWKLLSESSEKAAIGWLYQQIRQINSPKVSTYNAIGSYFSWSATMEGADYWRRKSEEAKNLDY